MGNLDKGWVIISRSIQDNWMWEIKPFSKGQAWIDLILLANHEDRKVAFEGTLTTVKRGQLLTSIRKLAVRWGWNTKTVRKFMTLLETDGMISAEYTTHGTTVTLIKYDDFQNHGSTKRNTKGSRDGARREHSMDTNKELKRIKKNEKENVLPSGEEAVGLDIPDEEWKEV